jgi:NADH-quinone oxidoreductase subunit J
VRVVKMAAEKEGPAEPEIVAGDAGAGKNS